MSQQLFTLKYDTEDEHGNQVLKGSAVWEIDRRIITSKGGRDYWYVDVEVHATGWIIRSVPLRDLNETRFFTRELEERFTKARV